MRKNEITEINKKYEKRKQRNEELKTEMENESGAEGKTKRKTHATENWVQRISCRSVNEGE